MRRTPKMLVKSEFQSTTALLVRAELPIVPQGSLPPPQQRQSKTSLMRQIIISLSLTHWPTELNKLIKRFIEKNHYHKAFLHSSWPKRKNAEIRTYK